jgi:hypothetical protein
MRFPRCGTPPLTKHSLLCWPVSGSGGLLLLWDKSPLHGKQGIQWSPACRRGWERCDGLSICHLALQRQWRCLRRWHREAVHEAGHGRRQYDVEMAEQRGVSVFVWEGRACDPLLVLAHLGWTAAASGTGARRSVVHRQRWQLRCG